MEQFITIFFAFISLYTFLRQSYWWQTKEYRFDRWWSWIKYNQGYKEFGVGNIRRPVLTFRILAMGISWLAVGMTINTWWGWVIAGYVGPIVGVILTMPINWLGKMILMAMAKKRIEQVKPKIIGITGSYGKTSSKEMLAQLLEDEFRIVKTLKNENSEISIAKRILSAVKPGIEIFIMEVGAYKQGEISRVCHMAPLDIAWVTAIGNQHLDLFGGQEKLKRAKFEIITGLKKEGIGVFNKAAGEEDLINWAKDLEIKSVIYDSPGKEGNLVGANKIAQLLGIKNPKKITLETNIKQSINGVKIIDNSYSTNQQAFETDIELLKSLVGRKFVVSPGIIELGSETGKVYSRLKDLMKDFDGVWLGEYKGIKETLKSGDTILIEGRIPTKIKDIIYNL
jgi:UDP-N-acetylmuramyl pentapeptide synthase